LPFADFAELDTYIATNFFLDAGGDTGSTYFDGDDFAGDGTEPNPIALKTNLFIAKYSKDIDGDQNIYFNDFGKIVLPRVIADTFESWDSVNNWFVIPYDGWYQTVAKLSIRNGQGIAGHYIGTGVAITQSTPLNDNEMAYAGVLPIGNLVTDVHIQYFNEGDTVWQQYLTQDSLGVQWASLYITKL
jgi:hypothetical protein